MFMIRLQKASFKINIQRCGSRYRKNFSFYDERSRSIEPGDGVNHKNVYLKILFRSLSTPLLFLVKMMRFCSATQLQRRRQADLILAWQRPRSRYMTKVEHNI